MKVYLDDMREPPPGWTLCRWPKEVIALLETGEVTHLSLDHDLGCDIRNGYDVLVWLEEAVALRGFRPPRIRVHTANPAAMERMHAAARKIVELARREVGS